MAYEGVLMTAEHRVIGAVRLFVVATVVGVLFIQQGAAQSAGFQRGEHVRIKAPTKPSDPVRRDMVLTVVAIPNDRIRFDDSGIYVNDLAVTAFSQDFLLRVTWTSGQVPQAGAD